MVMRSWVNVARGYVVLVMSLLGIHTYVGRFYADRVDLVCDPPGVIRVSFDKMILTV